MPDSKIFCNTPWYEIHIYWDGSFGICCQEAHKLYQEGNYNIANMTIDHWFNSEPVQQFRQQVLGQNPVSACSKCYLEEQQGGHSRRYNSNQKSAIFRQAFDISFEQSPGRGHFNATGITKSNPIDLHVDLGNFCNLACKMCNARASSKIASQEVSWGLKQSKQYLGTDWTKDSQVWLSFKQQLLAIPELNNIHFMGGETLLTQQFNDVANWLIEHKRFDIGLSFVTNGTMYDSLLIEKLTQFRRVGIEISIETIDQHNAYVRQGTNTPQVLNHITQYQKIANRSNITVTLRPAISALTIGSYGGLLQYALDQKLIIKSLLVNTPKFLDVMVLPTVIKQQYKTQYLDLYHRLDNVDLPMDFNASDPNNYIRIVKEQCLMCLNLLDTSQPVEADNLLGDLVAHCKRWDKIYGYNALELYPEFKDIWQQYGYHV